MDAETSSSSVSSSTTVSTQSSGKTRKPPKVLQISPPTLLVTASDFPPMSLCSPSLPTASLTPAMIPVSMWTKISAEYHSSINVREETGVLKINPLRIRFSSSLGQQEAAGSRSVTADLRFCVVSSCVEGVFLNT